MATKRPSTSAKASAAAPEDAGAIIRRQLIILLLLLAAIGGGYGLWNFGEDRGWGNADRAVKNKMDKAQQAFVNRNMEGAIRNYSQIIQRYPNHLLVSQALTGLATAYEENKQYDLAIQTYHQLLDKLGSDPAKADLRAFTQLQIGKLYAEKSDYDQAIQNYNLVLASYPKTDWAGEALSGIGKAYQARSDYSNAIKTYENVIKQFPKGFLAAEAQSAIGECYETQQKFKQAMKAYQTILKDYPAAVWDEAKTKIEALKVKLKSASPSKPAKSQSETESDS